MNNQSTVKGIMQNGVAAPYSFSIGEVYKEAWSSVHGFKATAWGAAGWVFLVSLAILIGMGIIGALFGSVDKKTMQMISNAVLTVFLLPLSVGMLFMAVHRAVGLPVQAKQVFNYYPKIWKILSVYIAQMAILAVFAFAIGFLMALPVDAVGSAVKMALNLLALLAGLACLYLVMGYIFAIYVRAEKNLGIWKSLEASRRAVTQHWFKLFFTYVGMAIILCVSMIPLGIGLIWTVPMALMVKGILYRTMFGVEEVR